MSKATLKNGMALVRTQLRRNNGPVADGRAVIHFAILTLAITIFVIFGMASAQGQSGAMGQTVPDAADWNAKRICAEIKRVAAVHDLPLFSFTRLIWTESRFDIGAVSPKGAQGIAQFMPATAAERGLADPFDPAQALSASASLLAELRTRFGNFGLAVAAYNAGPGRVARYLGGIGILPFETQDYVSAITGQPIDAFRRKDARLIDFSLAEGQSFEDACEALPVIRTRVPIDDQPEIVEPWGVQVAGHFNRTVAMRSWTRVRGNLRVALGDAKPQLHRDQRRRGVRAKWAVRLGAPTRDEALILCRRIRAAGGFCVVRKN
ncbi:MAG: lytic transglycosylase domain-containing protein [Pseudomonadota bacterium]